MHHSFGCCSMLLCSTASQTAMAAESLHIDMYTQLDIENASSDVNADDCITTTRRTMWCCIVVDHLARFSSSSSSMGVMWSIGSKRDVCRDVVVPALPRMCVVRQHEVHS